MTAPRILVVTGPTASGKTELGVRLAKELAGEVISADSMQIYKYMDVGTAKPAPEEMGGVTHHMLDVCSPFEKYSVARYVEEASERADDILKRGRLPIVVGGTGLYIDSLIMGRGFGAGGEDIGLRSALEREYDELGGETMLRKLAEKDPERAARLHPNDKKRVVRAMELANAGTTISEHDRLSREAPPRYEAKYVVLGYSERQDLYDRIDRRVDLMLERGLVDEVRRLLAMGLTREHTAMQAIGYKELCGYLAGEESLEEAVELIKRGSRRYAKRQISWETRYSTALRINWEKFPNIETALQRSTEFFAER